MRTTGEMITIMNTPNQTISRESHSFFSIRMCLWDRREIVPGLCPKSQFTMFVVFLLVFTCLCSSVVAQNLSQPYRVFKKTNQIMLNVGTKGKFDSTQAKYPCILKVGNEWWMWHNGRTDDRFTGSIGLATSKDGLHWRKTKITVTPFLNMDLLERSMRRKSIIQPFFGLMVYSTCGTPQVIRAVTTKLVMQPVTTAYAGHAKTMPDPFWNLDYLANLMIVSCCILRL